MLRNDLGIALGQVSIDQVAQDLERWMLRFFRHRDKASINSFRAR